MTQEERQFNKEMEKLAEGVVKKLKWYNTELPSKAGVLVEDIIPIIKEYIIREELGGGNNGN